MACRKWRSTSMFNKATPTPTNNRTESYSVTCHTKMSENTMHTHLETIKRKIGCEADDSLRAPKRARTSTITKPFYASHLTMLQSLYEKDNVSESTWNEVALFLQKKSLLVERKKKQEHLRGIHRQAVKYVQQQQQQQASAAAPPAYTTPQQLQSPSMFSPLGMSPATTTNNNNSRPRCSFALVARLLGLKAAAAQQDSTFSTLLTDTNTRIEQLEETLQELKLKRRDEGRKKMKLLLSGSHANDDDDDDTNRASNAIVETEMKIQLWKMLAHELNQVQ